MSQLALQTGSGPTDSAEILNSPTQQTQPPQHQQKQPQRHHFKHSHHQQNHHHNNNNHYPHPRQPPRLQNVQYYSQQRSSPASPASPTQPFSPTSPTHSPTSSTESPTSPRSPSSFARPFDGVSTTSRPQLQHLQRTIYTSPRSPRSPRKTPTSPLHASTAYPPPASPSPTSNFHFPFAHTESSSNSINHPKNDSGDSLDIPQIVTTAPEAPSTPGEQQPLDAEKTYFNSDSSGSFSPVNKNGPGLPRSPRFPDDNRSVSDSVVTQQPRTGSPTPRATMAGSSTALRPGAPTAPQRNPSVDSGISALSTSSNKAESTLPDIPSIIKAAGSPEAVIEHLLREKQAQSQQNSQLWRLVDKQRAMILGLNKDLERALREKEKYRKKLKEVLPDSTKPTIPARGARRPSANNQATNAAATTTASGNIGGPIPLNSGADRPTADLPSPLKETPLQSPVEMSMAPYPVTPPADQAGRAPSSAVGDILDPVESMPRPQDHALGHFDHDAEEQEAHMARKAAAASQELPISMSLPPSRSLPKPPQILTPRRPPPQETMSSKEPAKAERTAQSAEGGATRFPPPPAPPPRKPPPAPLQLRDSRGSPTLPLDDDVLESDSDYDSLLDVSEGKEIEKRGRRRTREEDDRVREIIVQKEAEMRSLSKKSKKGSKDAKANDGKENSENNEHKDSNSIKNKSKNGPVGSVVTQTVVMPSSQQQMPASLDGILSGKISKRTIPSSLSAPMLSPGLPSSPRPVVSSNTPKSPMHSPPLSPRMAGSYPPSALSPRPPRQPIPLPPNTPLQTPSPPGPAPETPTILTSPKALHLIKRDAGPVPSSPSTKSVASSRDSPVDRAHVYKGFVTEEYPDLLLPPNALPSVDVKVASSRMKPSRASLMSLTQLEEDPVFTLAIYSRADGGELWRVEKDLASLSKLDQRLKQCPAFTARKPDHSLFSGHAPAKLDLRRQVMNVYLGELMDTPLDTTTAIELCRYLSTNSLPPHADETGSSGHEARQEGSVSSLKLGPGGRPFRNGYLTKRGKNFGGWKARFFVLDGPHLKYYETPGGAHLGTIKLQNAQIGKQSQQLDNLANGSNGNGNGNGNGNSGSAGAGAGSNSSEDFDNQYRHAFLILEPKKKDPSAMTKHVLCAESDQERDLWVDALLRWIDYKELEDDEEAPSSKKDSNKPSGGSSSSSRKKITQSRKQQKHQQASIDSKDSLIGVSYEHMQQGELPQGAPGTRHARQSPSQQQQQQQQDHSDKHSTSTANIISSVQSPYAISAPRDPQVISDTSSWGNRAMLGGNLAPPTTEEKKVRKRSFFGFGTKVRTSGDVSQDALFDNNSGNNGPGGSNSNANNGGGPPRQVFGAPLAEAVRYNAPVDVRVPLPAVVYRCIQYLDANNAISEEGIFRLSGSNVVIKQLRERFNNESDVNLVTDEGYHDIHAVASLLKMYLRELPTTILTRELHMQFLSVTEMTNQEEKLAALNELSRRLPQANATLLKYLIAFLIKIINHADQNKMTVRNVGIVFSPTLNIPAPVFALLLQNYEAIFGIDPIEYELPSPASDRPSISSMSTADLPLPSTARPSTAHGNGSPHRQRLLESVMARDAGQPRNTNTGTPPPLASRSTATPTPPPILQPPPSYPLPIPGQQTQVRPAYESGFIVPPGYDPTQMPAPTNRNPGYDRPLYENTNISSGNLSIGGGSNTGNPPSQTSRSRLREETLY